MKKNNLSKIALVMALTMLLSILPLNIFAIETNPATVAMNNVVQYYKVNNKALSSWWELVALKGAGEDLNNGSWILPEWKSADLKTTNPSTDYAGYILGFLAKGQNPQTIWTDRNIVEELKNKQTTNGDFGTGTINNQIWAMIALDAVGYDYDKDNAVKYLLTQQKVDGGFTLSGTTSDPDVTGMALLALSNHLDKANVNTVINNIKTYIKTILVPTLNCNSLSTVISGLISVNENIGSPIWNYNGKSLFDNLMSFKLDNNSFSLVAPPIESNPMATIQTLIALGDVSNSKSVWSRLKDTSTSTPTPTVSPATTAIPTTTAPNIQNKSVHIRIEGINKNILDTNFEVISSGNELTALDALDQVCTSKSIDYKLKNSSYGAYIYSINSEIASTFGGYDGWMYLVNGESPYDGVSQHKIQNNDDIVFYYGMFGETMIPNIQVSTKTAIIGQSITVKATSKVAKYDDNWNYIGDETINIKDANVIFNDLSYKTNENGEATILSTSSAGIYNLTIEKDVSGSYPLMVRSENINIQFINLKNIHIRIEGINKNIADTNFEVVSSLNELTALDALAQVCTSKSIDYQIKDSSYGSYIFSINSEFASTFGGYDGWMYLVNGESPYDGVSQHKIQNNDDIVFYYGMFGETMIPNIQVSTKTSIVGQSITVKTTSKVAKYDDNWNYIGDEIINIKAANILFNNSTYKTNENGEATILSPSSAGTYDLTVEKDVASSYPLIVRSENIKIQYNPAPVSSHSGPSSSTQYITFSVTGDSSKGIILPLKTLELNSNDTPYSVLARELPGKISGSASYVKGIDGLNEFDKGPQSGWTYYINGQLVGISAGSYILKAGDKVEWKYIVSSADTLVSSSATKYPSTDGTVATTRTSISAVTVVENPKLTETKNYISDIIKILSQKVLTQNELSDWNLFSLARSGNTIPKKFVNSFIEKIKSNNGEFRKITDTQKAIIAAKALQLDPQNIAGVNLLDKVYNCDNLEKQGSNGVIFALIALDSFDCKIPANSKWTKDLLLKKLLEYQNSDGGFVISKGEKSNLDITAMALQALANYKKDENAKLAIEKALLLLSKSQTENGGFETSDTSSSETISQTIIALTSLDIELNDMRFTKSKGNLISALEKYKKPDGTYSHTLDGISDQLATEQAFMASMAYLKLLNGKEGLYNLNDIISSQFSDNYEISNWANDYIKKVSKYKLMQGTEKNTFEPKRSITRAEFIVLLMNLLKEQPVSTSSAIEFNDVSKNTWYYGFIMKAKEKGYVLGSEQSSFNPSSSITREQMATILNRIFKFQAFDTKNEIKDLNFVSIYAKDAVQKVFASKLMTGFNGLFSPKDSVTREMAAKVAVDLYEKN